MADSVWQRVIDNLPANTLDKFKPTHTAKLDIIAAILRIAKEQREYLHKRRYLRKLGGVIAVDILDKIIHWIQEFKKLECGHAGLPLSAIHLLLRIAVNGQEQDIGVLGTIEIVVRLMVHATRLENAEPSGFRDRHISEVYNQILQCLSIAVAACAVDSIVLTADQQAQQSIADEGKRLQRYSVLGHHLSFKRHAKHSSPATNTPRLATIRAWLSTVPVSQHHAVQRRLRVEGTGSKLLARAEFKEWYYHSKSSFFIIRGRPGCGKTVLASALIDHFSAPSAAPVAYFYCSASNSEPYRRSAIEVLRSIAAQLGTSGSCLSLEAAYDRREAGFSRPSIKECEQFILEALSDNPAYIIIDALDELEDAATLFRSLQKLTTETVNVLKIILVSGMSFDVHVLGPDTAGILLHEHNSTDLFSYTVASVAQAIKSRKLLNGNVKPDLKISITSALDAEADGIFPSIKLRLLRLCNLNREEEIIPALEYRPDLPLDIYDSVLHSISASVTSGLAQRTLSWLLHGFETLTSAVLLRFASTNVSIDELLDACQHLIFHDQETDTLQFLHSAVRDHLKRQPQFETRSSNAQLVEDCLLILMTSERQRKGPLCPSSDAYDYAALHWAEHLRLAQTATASVQNFLLCKSQPSPAFRQWWNTVKLNPQNHPRKTVMANARSSEYPVLFAICALSLGHLLETIHPPSAAINASNRYGLSPVYVASHAGDSKAVAALLARGARHDTICGDHGSALHCAAHAGHRQVAQLLVQHGAATEVGAFETAFHAACAGGQESIAEILLASHYSEIHDSLFDAAARAGFVKLMSRITALAPDAVRNDLLALQTLETGKLNVLEHVASSTLLTQHLPAHAIAIAAQHGHYDILQYLLGHFDLNLAGDFGTPLRTASAFGHAHICRLLLQHGADVNASTPFSPALHAAAMRGHANVIELLLDAGADVHLRGERYGTALQAAAFNGHDKAVELLLAAGAKIDKQGIMQDAFHAAVAGGHERIFSMLYCHEPTALPSRTRTYHNGWSQCRWPVPKNILRSDAPQHGKIYYPGSLKHTGDPADPLGSVEPIWRQDDNKTRPRDCVYWNELLEICSAKGNLSMLSTVHRAFMDREVVRATDMQTQSSYSTEGDLPMISAMCTAIAHDQPQAVNFLLDTCRPWDIPYDKLLSKSFESMSFASGATILCYMVPGDRSQAGITTFSSLIELMRGHLTHTRLQMLLEHYLPYAARKGRSSCVSAILKHCPSIMRSKLQQAFALAALGGHDETAQAIHDSSPRDEDWLLMIQSLCMLAAYNGLCDLLTVMTPSAGLDSIRESLLVAAVVKGHKDAVSDLLHQSTVLPAHLRLCLFIAGQRRHYDIQNLLMQHGAEIVAQYDAARYSGLLGQMEHLYGLDYSWVSELCDSREYGMPFENAWSGKRALVDVFQLAIHGVTNSPYYDPKVLNLDSPCRWRKGYKHADDLWNPIVCSDAELAYQAVINLCYNCNVDTIHKFEDLVAAFRHSSTDAQLMDVIKAAVQNERWCFALVKVILKHMPDIDLHSLLTSTMLHFDHKKEQSRTSTASELLPASDSIEQAFETGPAGLAIYLLQTLPGEKTHSDAHAVLLQVAAAGGKDGCVALLIERQVHVNFVCQHYGTALQAACARGHISVVHQLLEAGADVNIISGAHHSALHAAVMTQRLEIVQVLLSKGVIVNIDSRDHSPPLESALSLERLDIAMLLLSAGADIFVPLNRSRSMQSAFTMALVQSKDATTTRTLLAMLDRLPECTHETCQPQSCRKAILKAAMVPCVFEGNAQSVALLLSAGAYADNLPELMDKIGYRQPATHVIEIILEHLASQHELQSACTDALLCKSNGNFMANILQYLPCTEGMLLRACLRGDLDIVKVCLEAGIDVNAKDDKQRSAIHMCIAGGQLECAELLISHGVDLRHGVENALHLCVEALIAQRSSEVESVTVEQKQYLEHISQNWLGNMTNYGIYSKWKYGKWLDTETTAICERMYLLLQKHGHWSGDSMLGSMQHWAAFLGLQQVFDWSLVDDITPSKHFKASLAAAVQGRNYTMIKRMLESMQSDIESALEPYTLHKLCETDQWETVQLLLDHDVKRDTLNTAGESVLLICLRSMRKPKYAKIHDGVFSIIRRLLSPVPLLNSQELTELCAIEEKNNYQNRRTPKLFLEHCQDSEVAHVDFIRSVLDRQPDLRLDAKGLEMIMTSQTSRDHSTLLEILQGRLPKLTDAGVAAAGSPDKLSQLLDSDPAYLATTAVLDMICRDTSFRNNSRKSIKMLLDRQPSLVPTTTNIFAMLSCKQSREIDTLELMLDRSPGLTITKAMLWSVTTSNDLRALLNHRRDPEKVPPETFVKICVWWTSRHQQDLTVDDEWMTQLSIDASDEVPQSRKRPHHTPFWCENDWLENLLDIDGVELTHALASDLAANISHPTVQSTLSARLPSLKVSATAPGTPLTA